MRVTRVMTGCLLGDARGSVHAKKRGGSPSCKPTDSEGSGDPSSCRSQPSSNPVMGDCAKGELQAGGFYVDKPAFVIPRNR